MTRDEAIQVLQTALTSPFIYGEYAKAIDMAIEALSRDRPTGWIPVSERLPEKHGAYLVTFPSILENKMCVDIFQYYGDVFYDEVVAWMPLPEPYKGGGEK